MSLTSYYFQENDELMQDYLDKVCPNFSGHREDIPAFIESYTQACNRGCEKVALTIGMSMHEEYMAFLFGNRRRLFEQTCKTICALERVDLYQVTNTSPATDAR